MKVFWEKPAFETSFLCGEVWYKTSNSSGENAVIKEGISADKIGLQGGWIYAGSGTDSAEINNVILGDTYIICVLTKMKNGALSSFNASPQITYVVDSKSLIPNTPNNLSVTFTDFVNVSWDKVSNQDISYYELGYLNSYGVEVELIKTSECNAKIQMEDRNGTIYLYVVNGLGLKSQRATLSYSKPAPTAPTVTAKTSIDNVTAQSSAIPSDCLGVNFYFVGTGDNAMTFKKTQGLVTVSSLKADVYRVYACFYDLFGEGARGHTDITVKAYIDENLLKAESISLEKLTKSAQEAIENGGIDNVNIAVKGLLGEGSALVLQDDGSYALVASNGEKLTGLFANQDGVMRLQGSYIHLTGDTVIDGNVISKGMIQSGAVTAEKIDISNGATGARIVITDNLFTVYDDTGTVRVRFGVRNG